MPPEGSEQQIAGLILRDDEAPLEGGIGGVPWNSHENSIYSN